MRVSVTHKLSYNILYKLHAVSPGFVLSLFRYLFLSLFCDIVSSHNLSPGFSDSIKLPCSSHAFFSCHRMSSFLLFLRLSTAFEFDETFPVVPRIPPFTTPSHTAIPLSPLVAATSRLRFLFIHIVSITPALFSGT